MMMFHTALVDTTSRNAPPLYTPLSTTVAGYLELEKVCHISGLK